MSFAKRDLMAIGSEAGAILALALVSSAAIGAVRGLPQLAREADATSCVAPGAEAGAVVPWITAADALSLHGRATFVDARPSDEYAVGHVAGALSAPMLSGVMPPWLWPIVSGAPTVVVYCDTSDECAASTRLAGLLATTGHQDVRVLEGGFPAWLDGDYPAEAGPCAACP